MPRVPALAPGSLEWPLGDFISCSSSCGDLQSSDVAVEDDEAPQSLEYSLTELLIFWRLTSLAACVMSGK